MFRQIQLVGRGSERQSELGIIDWGFIPVDLRIPQDTSIQESSRRPWWVLHFEGIAHHTIAETKRDFYCLLSKARGGMRRHICLT